MSGPTRKASELGFGDTREGWVRSRSRHRVTLRFPDGSGFQTGRHRGRVKFRKSVGLRVRERTVVRVWVTFRI